MPVTTLKITVAGIRGIMGESLLPSTALKFAEIFGTMLKGGTIILGTDTRLSTLPIKSAVISGLSATGCKIIDIGIVSTPTTQIMVKELQANGGIMITASHNPLQWNGLKFISSKGIFLDEIEMQNIFSLYDKVTNAYKISSTNEEIIYSSGIVYAPIQSIGNLTTFTEAQEIHLNHICNQIDLNKIQSKKLKVVVDACNGAGAIMNPLLFKKLGVELIHLNAEPTGNFARAPEPLPENLKLLCEAVKKNKADIGFAQDADADRLAIVNEKGEPIGEDYTLVLVMKYLLSKASITKGKIVATNLSTTKAFDDVATEFETKIIRTKIGEVNVSKALMENDSIIGGEGNGGVIIPSIGFGRDSFAGIAFMLEYLASSNKTISQLVDSVPKYKVIKKSKKVASQEEVNNILKKIDSIFAKETKDKNDGIKIIFKNSWLHVRASNTEPIIRYFAEAPTLEEAEKLINLVF